MPLRLHNLLSYSSGRLKAVCLPVYKPQELAVFSVYFTQQNGVAVRPQSCIREVPTSNHSRKTWLSWWKFYCNPPPPQPQFRTCQIRIAFNNDRYLPNHLQQWFCYSMQYGVKQNFHTNSSQRFRTKKSGNCYTTYALRSLAPEKHITVKWHMPWSLDRRMVWKHTCSASSGMHSPDRQGVSGGPTAGLIPILVRNRANFSKLSFHGCNYGIFTGWCPCTPLATCTHKCHVLHFLSHWDAAADVEIY
jgi:hypothetical protein